MCDTFTLVGIQAKKGGKKKEEPKRSLHKLRNFALEDLSKEDLKLLTEYEEENRRSGGFTRIFPNQNWKEYAKYFESVRYKNTLLWKYIEDRECLIDQLRLM